MKPYALKRVDSKSNERWTGYYYLADTRLIPQKTKLRDGTVNESKQPHRIQKSAGTFATHDEALAAAEIKQNQINYGFRPDPEIRANATVRTFAPHFLERHPVGASTRDSYRRLLTNYVVPALGSVKITELDRTTLQILLDRLRREHSVPLATLRAIRSALTAMIGYAVRSGFRSDNCAKGISVPTVVRKSEHAWAPDVFVAFRKYLPTSGARLFASLQVLTGCRISELCAMVGSDFRSEDGTLSITKALVTVNKKSNGASYKINDQTKNGHDRTIHLDAMARQMLTEWIETNGIGDDDPLFTRALVAPAGGNGPLTPRAWSGIFNRAFQASGLAKRLRIVAKNLRHTHAVALLTAGRPASEVAARLGHTKEILLTHYAVQTLSVAKTDTSHLDAALAAFAA